MRIFQNIGIYRNYEAKLLRLVESVSSYQKAMDIFIKDRYVSCHILKPIIDASSDAFLSLGSTVRFQTLWANSVGMPKSATFVEILLAQIEHHRTEVFYNMDPIRFGDDFLKKLPGSVKYKIAWRAAPSPHLNFRNYDLLVNNFPNLRAIYNSKGFRTAHFFPAHDEHMNTFAKNENRPIDILFVGGYSQYHMKRADLLECMATLSKEFNVLYHIDKSRLTSLADSPLGILPVLRKYRTRKLIRQISSNGIFGLDLYEALSKSKITLNIAGEIAGVERGNMRCFEAMGCGSLLLSDAGKYPKGMIPGTNIITYRNPTEAVDLARSFLTVRPYHEIRELAKKGHQSILEAYSREKQWTAFQGLLK